MIEVGTRFIHNKQVWVTTLERNALGTVCMNTVTGEKMTFEDSYIRLTKI